MPDDLRARVLVVDDHPEMARLLADQLDGAGYVVETALGGGEALAAARTRPPDVVVSDLRMAEVDGLEVLAGVRQIDPTIPVIIMTAFGDIGSAVEAIKQGAYHYIAKPFRLDEILLYVERALADRRLKEENRALRAIALDRVRLDRMIGRSRSMAALFELIERVASSIAPVLVRGESGTGKELVARALHGSSPRRERPFVAVNCTAMPESLLESEIFGHVRGAFTGAASSRRGLFVEADGGTLLLDEVGDMPAALQGKLLRVLEDGQVRAVGADASRRVDVRVIASTHQPLEDRVSEGKFRADLFYRLNVIPLGIPPLRERTEDIPVLVEHFLARARGRNPDSRLKRLSPGVIAALMRHPWPGNVRELENVIERLVIVAASDTADVDLLEQHAPGVLVEATPLDRAKAELVPVRQLEDEYVAWVIRKCGGNKTQAASILGIDVSTIHRRERGAPR